MRTTRSSTSDWESKCQFSRCRSYKGIEPANLRRFALRTFQTCAHERTSCYRNALPARSDHEDIHYDT